MVMGGVTSPKYVSPLLLTILPPEGEETSTSWGGCGSNERGRVNKYIGNNVCKFNHKIKYILDNSEGNNHVTTCHVTNHWY